MSIFLKGTLYERQERIKMENEVKSIEDLQKEIDKKGQKVEDVNILFLDLSSSCTGYSLVKVSFTNKKASLINAGAIWFDASMTNQDKYHYIFNAITNYFNIVGQIDYCVAEAYMINSKKMMGSHVGPEMHGALIVALAEIGVKYSNILPQVWRKALDIKPNITFDSNKKKKRDFKLPTKNYVDSVIPNIPQMINSNVTSNQRAIPNDLYDALAISLGFLKKIGINNLDFSKLKIQSPIDL
jgi:Holliday junction resolvasome RuvABC endonuclease subunit